MRARPPTCAQGLSPRGRGKLPRQHGAGEQRRSIPAWAGETFVFDTAYMRIEVYPRVGGGNPIVELGVRVESGLSPRGRGKPRRCRPM